MLKSFNWSRVHFWLKKHLLLESVDRVENWNCCYCQSHHVHHVHTHLRSRGPTRQANRAESGRDAESHPLLRFCGTFPLYGLTIQIYDDVKGISLISSKKPPTLVTETRPRGPEKRMEFKMQDKSMK